jgi:hypothetical protein
VTDIQVSYVLPNGRRVTFVRAHEAAFHFDEDGAIHGSTVSGKEYPPDHDTREARLSRREFIWCAVRIHDNGRSVVVREGPMELSDCHGERFTLTPTKPAHNSPRTAADCPSKQPLRGTVLERRPKPMRPITWIAVFGVGGVILGVIAAVLSKRGRVGSLARQCPSFSKGKMEGV